MYYILRERICWVPVKIDREFYQFRIIQINFCQLFVQFHSKWLFINPFVPNAPFLYYVKTSENLTVFCFQGVEKGCIGNEWVKRFIVSVLNDFWPLFIENIFSIVTTNLWQSNSLFRLIRSADIRRFIQVVVF